jgi:hypothetical protein
LGIIASNMRPGIEFHVAIVCFVLRESTIERRGSDASVLAQASEARNHNEVVERLKHVVDGVDKDRDAVVVKRQSLKCWNNDCRQECATRSRRNTHSHCAQRSGEILRLKHCLGSCVSVVSGSPLSNQITWIPIVVVDQVDARPAFRCDRQLVPGN